MDKIGQAYGAGLAGGSFDPVTFIKKPHVILRIFSLVFAIVVFGCISSGAWIKESVDQTICVYSRSPGTCGFGTAIGVLAFLVCVIFLVVDAYFENISSVQLRKRVVIGDLAASGIFLFFWFITFCVLTNKWTTREFVITFNKDPPQAAIAFSFFSILTWAGLLLFAFRRYKEGSANAFAPTYEQDFSAAGAPPFYPGVGGVDPYQEPPFTASNDSAAPPTYQQPTY